MISPVGHSAERVATIERTEVVCGDMMCFQVDSVTLDPLTCCYYEPAALADPRGPQMSYGEWVGLRAEQRNRLLVIPRHE